MDDSQRYCRWWLGSTLDKVLFPKDLYVTLATRKAKMRVLFSPPATILWVDGKKYVSKAHGEEFDEEKGLLMCLAKANGITHLDLKRLLKNAERPNEKNKNKEN